VLVFTSTPKAIDARDAVKAITQNTFTDEVAVTLSGLIRGWETTMLMPQTAV